MKAYLDYKNQINGLGDVADTVKTTEKIAASAIHSLKKKVSSLDSYTSNIENFLNRLSLFYSKKDNDLLQEKENNEKMLVILTGNKGLVGDLWHKVIDEFLNQKNKYQFIVVVGQKGNNYLQEEKISITKSFVIPNDVYSMEDIKQITDYIFSEFHSKNLSKIDILYPHFISLAEQRAVIIPFLPFQFNLNNQKEHAIGFPIFITAKKIIFNNLLQKYIRVIFSKIIMETKLSEFSARTVSMEHANVKIGEFIKKSTLNYMKRRRRFMTQKQLESFIVHKII